jgi:hypothetical protein
VRNHPGNEYVSTIAEEGLRGAFIPVILDILPVRAFWIMTKKWGCPEKESAEAIKHFAEVYNRPRYSCI